MDINRPTIRSDSFLHFPDPRKGEDGCTKSYVLTLRLTFNTRSLVASDTLNAEWEYFLPEGTQFGLQMLLILQLSPEYSVSLMPKTRQDPAAKSASV